MSRDLLVVYTFERTDYYDFVIYQSQCTNFANDLLFENIIKIYLYIYTYKK